MRIPPPPRYYLGKVLRDVGGISIGAAKSVVGIEVFTSASKLPRLCL